MLNRVSSQFWFIREKWGTSKQKVQTLSISTSTDRQHINTECDQEFKKPLSRNSVSLEFFFLFVCCSLLIGETQQNHFVPVKFLSNDPKAPRKQSASDGEERNIVPYFCFFVLFPLCLGLVCCNLQVEPFWKSHFVLAACILLPHCCSLSMKG